MALEMIKSLWGATFSGKDSSPDCEACSACVNVVPGTVTPHNMHVLIRLSRPMDAPATGPSHALWPERVDDDPAIVAVNNAIEAFKDSIRGPVKVTAFEYPQSLQIEPQPEGTSDVLIFPAAVVLKAVPLATLGETVVQSLSLVRTSDPKPAPNEEKMKGSVLLVCCHAKRDARCGYLGPRLADKFTELGAQVFLSSHIGGHQYAGNVISYGSRQPSAGTWFGGLSSEQAEEFLEALKALPLSGDPASDKKLRKWWRGRVGLTKEEQKKHFNRCTKQLQDIEDAT